MVGPTVTQITAAAWPDFFERFVIFDFFDGPLTKLLGGHVGGGVKVGAGVLDFFELFIFRTPFIRVVVSISCVRSSL